MLGWRWQGLAAGWGSAGVPPALPGAGTKEGLLAGVWPPKALSGALLTCLSERGPLTFSLMLGLGFAAGLSAGRVLLARLHAVFRH